jgi:cell division transport system ATP-binding protein
MEPALETVANHQKRERDRERDQDLGARGAAAAGARVSTAVIEGQCYRRGAASAEVRGLRRWSRKVHIASKERRRADARLRAESPSCLTLREFSHAMISVQHVTKQYKNDVAALDDVSVEVEKGEFVFIVGPSGSGKSTFIRLLLKEEEPSSGTIYVAGKSLKDLSSWKVPYLRRNVGTVFQDFKLLPDRTVFQNVAFALEVIGKPKSVIDQRVPEILELVGLGDKLNSFPNELSGGEEQRVSIARAAVNRPLIMLCDEPTGNLDPNTSADIMKLLDRINRIGTTIVMATHDSAIVDAMRRRVVELDAGKVVRDQERGVYGYGT